VPCKDDEEPLEVTEDDIPTGSEEHPNSDIEDKIDSVLEGATIEDIVAELEDLATIYKVREIPRRWARVDMLLSAKGLGSIFSTVLSEIQNRALDSNNYISTRAEDILSKLRGSIVTDSVDLEGKERQVSPDVSGIKSKLEQDADKEKQRKQMRKQKENEDLEQPTKETPEVEMTELAEPVQTAPVPPVAPKPLA
jgi:hypothetical protein